MHKLVTHTLVSEAVKLLHICELYMHVSSNCTCTVATQHLRATHSLGPYERFATLTEVTRTEPCQ